MKLNKIFMALAATAIVGCTSDDLNEFTSSKQAVEDSRLIELNENFVLAGVGAEGATTRTHWEQDAETKAFVNKFLPIWATAPGGSSTIDADADLEAQTVGLCWLGQGAVGTDVYTNYEFYHFGWLNKGETEADLDKCGELYNGSLYSDITAAGGTANAEAVPGTDWTTAGMPAKSVKAGVDNLNYNSGVYKTKNKAIFGGQYIVYYPFNKDFEEAGTIPAAAETNWTAAPVDASPVKGWMAPEIGKATFRYSAPVTIEGGNQAANFGLYNLSAIVQLRLATAAGELTTASIDQIVLYSASEKLLKKAYLAADKIVAGATGADLYADTEGTKTIVATPTTAISFDAAGKPSTSAYITVLPTTVDDLVALVHNNTDGKWAQISLGNTEFKAGSAKRLDIIVKAADFTTDFIAVDETSLTASLNAARTAAGASAPYTPQTITVIGDITIGEGVTTAYTYNINGLKDAAITIKGDDIIVPELVTLNLNTNMESEVRVLGTSCCSGAATGGRLRVIGGTISDVTMEPTEARVTPANYDALSPRLTYVNAGTSTITVAAGKTIDVKAGNVDVNKAVQHKGDIVIAEDAKVTVASTGSLSFLGSTVDNYGTIEVMKAGEFYVKNANGTAVWTDGQNMTNHSTGKFIHNVDAVVGTAVQFMNQEDGCEYRCRVDKQKALDDAYTQWTACNVIEMISPSTPAAVDYDLAKACQHKYNGELKYVDIEVNNTSGGTDYKTTFNDTPSDGLNIQIGNLTVNTELQVNYAPKSDPAKTQRQLTVNGDMTVSADTELTESKKVTVTGDLAIDNGATLTYKGANKIVEGLKVNGDITVTDAIFAASDDGAILIECTNFSLINEDATYTNTAATFGNRTAGDTNKSMTVNGTISNGKGCTFTISPASGANLLAWITCYKVEGEGTYAGTPTVIQPAE